MFDVNLLYIKAIEKNATKVIRERYKVFPTTLSATGVALVVLHPVSLRHIKAIVLKPPTLLVAKIAVRQVSNDLKIVTMQPQSAGIAFVLVVSAASVCMMSLNTTVKLHMTELNPLSQYKPRSMVFLFRGVQSAASL